MARLRMLICREVHLVGGTDVCDRYVCDTGMVARI